MTGFSCLSVKEGERKGCALKKGGRLFSAGFAACPLWGKAKGKSLTSQTREERERKKAQSYSFSSERRGEKTSRPLCRGKKGGGKKKRSIR